MRLAVLSDIHGNLLALEAVLADLKAAGGADRTWILGDLAMAGPRPAECVKAVRDLVAASPKTVEVIGGNTDRRLVTGALAGRKNEKPEDWAGFPNRMRWLTERVIWTAEKLSWDDAEFLSKIARRELELEIPGYGWAIGYHGGPGDDEFIMDPKTPDEVVLDALHDREGRIGFGGHTHNAMDRDLGRWRVVNVGSIGLPDDDPRATYAIATFERDAAFVDIRRVPFDTEAVIADMNAQNHPDREWVADSLRHGRTDYA